MKYMQHYVFFYLPTVCVGIRADSFTAFDSQFPIKFIIRAVQNFFLKKVRRTDL